MYPSAPQRRGKQDTPNPITNINSIFRIQTQADETNPKRKQHNQPNQKRENTKARERNNTKQESKREQPKTAQISRFWHYLKKESANLCQIRANKGIYLLSTALCPAYMIQVSARGELAQYRAIIGINRGRDSGHNPKRGKRTQSAKRGTQPTKRESKRGGGKCSTTTIQAQSIGRGYSTKTARRGSLQKNLGTKSTKTFWVSRKFWFSKNFQTKFWENEKGVCI